MSKIERYKKALKLIAKWKQHCPACFGGTRYGTGKRVAGPEGRDHCDCPIKVAKDALYGKDRPCRCLGCLLVRKDKKAMKYVEAIRADDAQKVHAFSLG